MLTDSDPHRRPGRRRGRIRLSTFQAYAGATSSVSHRPEQGHQRHLHLTACSLVAASFALASCTDSPSEELASLPPVAFHLSERLPFADAKHEVKQWRLGTPEARLVLGDGWSHDEPKTGPGGVWSDGEVSEVHVFLTAPRPLTLKLTGAPYAQETMIPQTLAVEVNGIPLTRLTLESVPSTYKVEVPEGAWSAGANTIRFRYGYAIRPTDVDSGATDSRELGVFWTEIALEDGCEGAGPYVEASGSQVVLPPCSQLDYYAKIPDDAVLLIPALSSTGSGDRPSLAVVVEHDQSDSSEEYQLKPASDAQIVPLGETSGIVRISLRNTATSGARQPRKLVLQDPRVHFARDEIPPAAPPPVGGTPSNVILYVIDTLRPDHLSAYAYPRPTSPSLEAFATDATVFMRAIAQSSWTRSAMASIMTGLEPERHTVHDRDDALPESADTLAEMLRGAGYRTGGFVANPNVQEAFGFRQGFETYEYTRPKVGLEHDARDLTSAALRWLAAYDGASPFFLYIHAMEPHDPYTPREPYRSAFAADVAAGVGSVEYINEIQQGHIQVTPDVTSALIDLYDAEIAASDAVFGEFLDELEQRNLLANTLVIVVSDHGEAFGEHGDWRHGNSLHAEQLDVVLIVRFPDGLGRGARSNDWVQQIDIVPTALTYAGIRPSVALAGSSLRAAPAPDRPAFPTLRLGPVSEDAAIAGGAKWMVDRQQEIEQLYDLSVDPTETHDLLGSRPILGAYLRQLRLARDSQRPDNLSARRADLGDADTAQLRALGYIE